MKFNEENKDNKNTIEKIQQLTLKKPDDMEGNCNNGRGVSDLSDFNYDKKDTHPTIKLDVNDEASNDGNYDQF